MAAGDHFGWPKITFDRISRHFRSIRNYLFTKWLPAAILDDRKVTHFSPFQINTPFWMTGNHFLSHFSPFQINTQLLFLWFFSTKWLPAAILDDWKSLSIAFLAVSDQYATWMTENHFWSNGHFGWPKITFDRYLSPFQINTQLFFFDLFFQNGHRPPFWKSLLDDRKSLSIAFLAISDQYTTFFCLIFFQNGLQWPFWKSDLRQKQ